MQVWNDWNSQKIMDLEFPGNKHIYKMCPQIFIKFHAAAKILSSKGQKFSRKIMESNVFCNMHNFTFCPKYLHSFFKNSMPLFERSGSYIKTGLTDKNTDQLVDWFIQPALYNYGNKQFYLILGDILEFMD